MHVYGNISSSFFLWGPQQQEHSSLFLTLCLLHAAGTATCRPFPPGRDGEVYIHCSNYCRRAVLLLRLPLLLLLLLLLLVDAGGQQESERLCGRGGPGSAA